MIIINMIVIFQSQHFWVYDQNLENQLVQNSWYIWHDQMNSGKCDLLETTCWLFITRAGTSTHWIDQNQKLQIDTDSNNHHHHSKGTAIWLFVIRYYQLKCFVRSQIILVQLLVAAAKRQLYSIENRKNGVQINSKLIRVIKNLWPFWSIWGI